MESKNISHIACRIWWIYSVVHIYFGFPVERASMIDSPPTYTSEHEYITVDANFNHSVYTRALPPVPKDCPTPMGVCGKIAIKNPNCLSLFDK